MSERKRSTLAAILVPVLALSLLAGCTKSTTGGGGGTTSSGPQRGGSISFFIGEPAYIDPYNTQESEGTQVEQSLFDSLTAFDPVDPTKLVPAAAEKWSSNANATVWTFNLNKNDKFSDGSPVRAQDFIYAWNRIADPKTVNTATKKVDASIISYHLAPVEGFDAVQSGTATGMAGLKAVDDFTLQVTLTHPFGDFGYVVAHPALAPVPQKYVEGGVDFNGTKVPYGLMPVGNGPFKMSEPWKSGQFIKVARNDSYYGEKPLLDGIDFRIFKDPNTAYQEFEAGTLDFSQIGEGKIKDAEAKFGTSDNGYTAEPGKQVLLGAENSIYYLVVNLKDKSLQNVKFREALSLGINRQAICEAVFQGTRDPADNIVPPGIGGYAKDAWPLSKFDATEAKAALEAAGFPGGKGAPPITLSYNGDGGHQKIMELIQADLTNLGLKVTLSPTADFPTYLKQLDAGKVMLGRLGWSADYPIMDNFLYPLFDSKSTDNKSGFADPKIDVALAKARETADAAARIAAYQEIDKTIGQQMPVIPIMFYKHHHVVSSRVHDLTYSAMNLVDFPKVWVSGGSSAPSSGTSSETTTK